MKVSILLLISFSITTCNAITQCSLFEKENLIVNFTKLNKSDNYLLSAYYAPNKDYWTSFFCVKDTNGNPGAYHCMGDDDSGRLWIKSDGNIFKVKFGNMRLDSEYRNEADEIESKYIMPIDGNYKQGKDISCL